MNIILEQSNNETLRFAGSELRGYLALMGDPGITYRLGISDLTSHDMPAVADRALDDQYLIEVSGDEGLILGGNARSVLLGVYRYLTLLGCAFLRPGKEFEVVPKLNRRERFYAREKRTASLRHRGVCIEGSVAENNITDFIDWLPKIGYNAFFSQFETPHTFLWRYYTDTKNPLRPSRPYSMEESFSVMRDIDAEMKKRGILQHRVGHGWTGRALGLKSDGWETNSASLDDRRRAMIAEVSGKRALWGGVPANTNLCMSSPDAAEAFAEAVAAYAKENPDVDYLHIWLADDCNNHCECEACRRMRPSDHYLNMLNRIDEKLTAAGSSVRIVMLLYVDLLWAPEVTRLNHPSRFVLMFAPITRSFEQSFDETDIGEKEPPFARNKLSFPRDLGTYLRFLKNWQTATAGCDCFDYDYYLGRSEYGDPTLVNPARIVNRDLKKHKELGLNGLVSCQNLRNHLPNGLSGYVMGESLFDTALGYEELAEKYCHSAYGENGGTVRALLEELSSCFRQNWLFYEVPETDEPYAASLSRVPALADRLADLCAAHAPCAYEAQERMWEELSFFADYVRLYATILKKRAEGDREGACRLFETEFRKLAHGYDLRDQSALDPWRLEVCAYLHLK